MEIWYNIVRYYTSADLRPTKGRTISQANHAHPPEGKRINALSMDEGHGIMFAAINVVSCKKYPRYFAAVVWMETNSV